MIWVSPHGPTYLNWKQPPVLKRLHEDLQDEVEMSDICRLIIHQLPQDLIVCLWFTLRHLT